MTEMEWRKCYVDLVLVPLAILFSVAYHAWLWHKVRSQPLQTFIGINSAGRRKWVIAMIKDNEKKNILAVQSLRNAIMGSTLMATTSILLSTGLAAILSSTYSIKKPLGDNIFGAHGEFMVALKYVTLLLAFIFAFLCYSLSIRFINQVNFLINIPFSDDDDNRLLSPEYVSDLLDKGFVLNTVGNRLFYAALPLLLWLFGPVLVFLCSLIMVPLLYNIDIVSVNSASDHITKGVAKV
ncbi:ABC transporter type 1 transmembrane domain MetI-like protein [Dioscorea alata]|uniref:ABC transporter type 1 transmembrane domain MetI-like protein n=1 Tax=Dioscorea alata TaxID=55571 RepID=A0ACB7VKT9_DIOAL|nr:ABC transporter type 1 transmembrane domain MetI-like protein [Dioscorea alata]